jgi:hypothetical protein
MLSRAISARAPSPKCRRSRLSGGTVSTISLSTVPGSLAFDGTSFWATVGPSGTLVRVPASGGPAVTIAAAYSAAVVDDCVYFSVETLDSSNRIASGSGIYSVRR